MNDPLPASPRARHALAAIALLLAATGALAQQPVPLGAPPGPPAASPPGAVPGAVPPMPGTAYDPAAPAGASPRFLFAGALAMIAKSVGSTFVGSLNQGITNWFTNGPIGQKLGTAGWAPPPAVGMGGIPGMPGALPGTGVPPGLMTGPPGAPSQVPPGYPPPSAGGGWPPPAMPSASMPGYGPPPGAWPAPGATGVPIAPPAPQWPNASPAPSSAGAAAGLPGSAPAMPVPVAPTLYAGIAFEVHVIAPTGVETTVDPGSYVFHTGERFLVYYRPSLPGRVRVLNVSPTGEVLPIETLTLAGGELAKLGPYQLTDPAGDEALRLVLEPCSSPELVTATRNIVKATDAPVGSGVPIGACSATPAPPGLGTRNIVKATMDGSTGFALDPVSSQELAAGHLAPRETSITIHHR